MAAGNTYVALASTTLGTDTASVTFNSFAGYTDLVLIAVCSVDGATNTSVRFRYNATGGTGYSATFLEGDGSSATSSRATSASYGYMGNCFASSTNFSVNVTNIQNYANSTTYKTHITRGNNASQLTSATVGLWSSTAAITSIDLYPGTLTNFKTGSTFTLYGIAAA